MNHTVVPPSLVCEMRWLIGSAEAVTQTELDCVVTHICRDSCAVRALHFGPQSPIIIWVWNKIGRGLL